MNLKVQAVDDLEELDDEYDLLENTNFQEERRPHSNS